VSAGPRKCLEGHSPTLAHVRPLLPEQELYFFPKTSNMMVETRTGWAATEKRRRG
jgi:hypothetical protein